MIGLNEYIPRRVIVKSGIKDIGEIVPGDEVYEYGTNQLLKVRDVIQSECHEIFSIQYSDKRTDVCGANDLIFTGQSILPVKEAAKKIPPHEIKLHPILFDSSRVQKPLNPDPYVAGALLTYGDYDEKYLNLPLDRYQINNTFSHKYNVDYFPHIKNNRVYFQWKGKSTDQKITWEEFFPDYIFYAKTHRIYDPPYPKDYLFTSYENRRQFVRGIFDMGYDITNYPDEVAIYNVNEDKLKWVQWILWSLGIPSSVYWDPKQTTKQNIYTLRILGDYHQYPGFFYDIDFIERSIRMHEHDSPHPEFTFKINSIEPVQWEIRHTYGFTKNLVLEKPHQIYMSDSFLPRVSL